MKQTTQIFIILFNLLLVTTAHGDPLKLKFLPLGGLLYEDIAINNFVDMDSTSGAHDFDCGSFTYDGHDALDIDLKSFGEQDIGVPVFSAYDGIVSRVVDGNDDKNICPDGPCSNDANLVEIDHTGNRKTSYLHLRNGSVIVTKNQAVKAGKQIGLVGSSGNSTKSHLHFGVYDNGNVVETFNGSCNASESQWVTQLVIKRDVYLEDFGFIKEADIGTLQGPPYEFPRTGHIALNEDRLGYWMMIRNLPAYSTYRVQFERPDGTIAFDSGDRNLNGSQAHRNSWWQHEWNIDDIHQITGTWSALIDINYNRVIEAPFEVMPTRDPDFNRPPADISVSILPHSITVEDPIICKVSHDDLLGDPDYDIVRYRYLWKADNLVIRDNIFASKTDMIPHHLAPAGSEVSCTVTVSDGKDAGNTVTAAKMVPHANSVNIMPILMLLLRDKK